MPITLVSWSCSASRSGGDLRPMIGEPIISVIMVTVALSTVFAAG